jgi:hypothetical protein
METVEKTTLLEVEKIFTDRMYDFPGMTASISQHLNICCDERDEDDIISMGNKIKTTPEFSSLTFREIYIVLVYIYYSLRLNEQTTDWLDIEFLQEKLLYNNLALKLLIDIISGDIMINGHNFSSVVRRYILGMKIRGGKRKKSKKNRLSKKSRLSKKKTKYNRIKKYI